MSNPLHQIFCNKIGSNVLKACDLIVLLRIGGMWRLTKMSETIEKQSSLIWSQKWQKDNPWNPSSPGGTYLGAMEKAVSLSSHRTRVEAQLKKGERREEREKGGRGKRVKHHCSISNLWQKTIHLFFYWIKCRLLAVYYGFDPLFVWEILDSFLCVYRSLSI